MGDDNLVVLANQDRKEALAGPRRELDLLLRGAANVAGVDRVPADRDEKTGRLPRDGHRRLSVSGSGSGSGAAIRLAASTASALDPATNTPARSRARRCAP